MSFSYKYEMPVVTASVACFYFNKDDQKYYFIFIKRKKDPFVGQLALPGGHLDVSKGETILECASRELFEETNLSLDKSDFEFFCYSDDPNRDPRGRYIDFIFVVDLYQIPQNLNAGDDASEIVLVKVDDIINDKVEIAFDHSNVVKKVIEKCYLCDTIV